LHAQAACERLTEKEGCFRGLLRPCQRPIPWHFGNAKAMDNAFWRPDEIFISAIEPIKRS